MLGVEAVLVQAVDALAGAPGNVGVILDAGALEPLLEALTGRDHASAAAAAHALGLLAREEDARLGSLPHAPLQVSSLFFQLQWTVRTVSGRQQWSEPVYRWSDMHDRQPSCSWSLLTAAWSSHTVGCFCM